MVSRFQAHFSASLGELPRMLLWVRTHLIDAKMDASAIPKAELASEEAIVNVIHHAYKDKGGEIELRFHLFPTYVEIVVVDQGPPFNPLRFAPDPDLSNSLEKRKEGGMGVFLIRKCVDEVRYLRENGANVLTLIKHFSRKK